MVEDKRDEHRNCRLFIILDENEVERVGATKGIIRGSCSFTVDSTGTNVVARDVTTLPTWHS